MCKSYRSGFWRNKKIDAVKNVSFQINEGEIFGLVGGSSLFAMSQLQDVSVQAQIVELINQKEKNISILYILHNLDVIRAVCHRVSVMKNGEIVEVGDVEDVFEFPQHPYTKELIASAI